ncbi:hypothetical protein JCGZ_20008 [Jatropha curcas]|uniref:Uncharacterized protein n=1 Tax=Jatropha curcas TaxID=180498 RepID=A0A067K5Y1_JATCU|nr:hypothetical protein JCGZ_20008 [Jatropha curcas]
MPRLEIDPASLILLMFGFLAYEIPTYEIGADVVPLRQLVKPPLEMNLASLYWAPLVCFCILSQYLLLSGIKSYGSLRLVPVVKYFLLILAEMLSWLGDRFQDPDSRLSLIGSLLLL